MTAEKNPDLQISDEKRLELLFDEWKVVIETQMHFNDMIMRVRATGVTLGEPKVLGMTTLIRDSVGKPGRAKRYLWFFYGLVFFVGAIFLVSILLGFVPPPS